MKESYQHNMIELLLALLRGALIGEEIEECRFAGLDSESWQQLFKLSHRNKVTALAFDGVLMLSEDHRPSRKIYLPWLAESEKAVLDYKRKQQSERHLVYFFQQHGIPTLILKGTSISRYYPQPSHRPSADIDIYQYGHHIEADRLIAEQLGIKVTAEGHHHTKYLFEGATVESHFDFVNVHTPPSNKEYEQILKSLDPSSATFEVLFLLRHMAGHFVLSGITLRDICDWAMLLKTRSAQVDWPLVEKYVSHFCMRPFVSILQAVAEDEFSISPISVLPRTSDTEMVQRFLVEVAFGEFAERTHSQEDFGRLLWKVRRYRASRWKFPLVYSDSRSRLFFSSMMSHLQRPRSIIHKV